MGHVDTYNKSILSSIVPLLLLLIVVQSQTHIVKAQAQSCSTSLGNLNVCAPFLFPGASNTNPSDQCCSAIQATDHDCLCNFLRVSARLPTQCNLPIPSCSGMP
ncbi:hypothetical protein Leryth_015573 [Lithospermum erythrorhizon]|nr:hypothetical protein Leryth_015573 [Lithospermum erythrorhizon]